MRGYRGHVEVVAMLWSSGCVLSSRKALTMFEPLENILWLWRQEGGVLEKAGKGPQYVNPIGFRV